jgi:hypothetical protein
MGDLEKRNLDIRQLTSEERAVLAGNLAADWSKGLNDTKLMEKYHLTRTAVKTLKQEHAAYIRNAMPETRSLAIEEYLKFYGELADIQPDDGNYPALVRAKAIEGRIQIKTRLDKLLGHEIQGDIDGAVNTVAEMVKQMNTRGDFDGIAASELGNLEEDIIDIEPVEDDDGE